jgi:hypothetical protein
MSKLKAYTLGNNGFVDSSVQEALGEPTHIRQASVLVFAYTKAQAIAELEWRRRTKVTVACPTSTSDPEFRVASGPTVDALLDSWIDKPTVVVTPSITRSLTPVVRIADDGSPRFWGILRRVEAQVVFSLEQMPESSR